jgi:hypothetical protein
MTPTNTYYIAFEGDLTPDEQQALQVPGFELHVNAAGSEEAVWLDAGERPSGVFEMRHVVRVKAEDEDDARARFVDALGREPDGLTVASS